MQITMDPGTDPALPIPTHVMKVLSTKHTQLDLYKGFLERLKLITDENVHFAQNYSINTGASYTFIPSLVWLSRKSHQ